MVSPGQIDFGGSVALVTGGAAGLGRAIAEAFSVCGADVAVCDRDEAGLVEVAAAVEGAGRRCHAGVLDVRDPEAAAGWVSASREALGRVDVLVNNAGGTFRSEVVEVTSKGQSALIAENFTQVADLCRLAAPHLGSGSAIVNVTSIEAHRAAPGFGIYAAMKAAVESLTRTLALELGHRGIRVNAVAPDAVPTGGEEALGAEVAGGAYEHTTPLGRRGRPSEVAWPTLFLASDLASFVTGTTLHVDGGNDAARGWRRREDGAFVP